MNTTEKTETNEIGFRWWVVSAWLGLTVGNLAIVLDGTMNDMLGVALAIAAINTALCVLILRFNKYAFLVATILSINPLLWIINGIYLKNRWNHPKVNAAK